jgi:hypothetical protein
VATVNKSWLIPGALLLAVGLAVFSLTAGSATNQVRTITVVSWLACSFCGQGFKGELGDRPGRCPHCGEQGVWPAQKCRKCRSFVAIDLERFNEEKREPYCLRCGSALLVAIEQDPP